MTVVNFPGVIPEQTQEEKISNVKNDIKKLEEYLEKAQDYVDGVLLVTFSKKECHHWMTPGLSVPEIYFMLGRIQNDLIDYADTAERE